MAANAYILINTEPPKTREVVELEADTHEDLVGVLRQQILPINGIVDTITCLWF